MTTIDINAPMCEVCWKTNPPKGHIHVDADKYTDDEFFPIDYVPLTRADLDV